MTSARRGSTGRTGLRERSTAASGLRAKRRSGSPARRATSSRKTVRRVQFEARRSDASRPYRKAKNQNAFDRDAGEDDQQANAAKGIFAFTSPQRYQQVDLPGKSLVAFWLMRTEALAEGAEE